MRRALVACVKRYAILAMLVTSCVLRLPSATLERLSLDDMITRSTTIVRGKVAASWASEQFKGTPRNSVEVMLPGGTARGLSQSFSGSPVLKQGDEFVFFLWTSKGGITWITGLTQGLFALAPGDAATDRTATRAASRELMLDQQTSRPVKDTALTMGLSELRSRIAATLAAQGGGK
jgi:hypothetical protein